MSKKNLVNVFFLLAIKLALDLAYVHYIGPFFGYEGFVLVIDGWQYFASWILYALMVPLAPHTLSNVSDAVFSLVVSAVMAPLTSMYGLSGGDVTPVIMAELSFLMIWVIVRAPFVKVVRLPSIKNSEPIAVILSVFVIGVVVLHFLISGVHLSMDLIKVYDFRRANESLADNGLFAYLNPWAYQVFNLFLIAYFLMRKRYVLTAAAFCVQIFLFAASQQKSVLFTPFVIVGVWWYLRKSRNLIIMPVALCALIFVSLAAHFLADNTLLASIAVRRLLFVPVQLDYAYYNFFSTHPKVMWSDSFWMPFAHSPYRVAMSYVIGDYLGSPDMHANDGYVASGFGHAGPFGVFVYTVILGFTLKFVDNESRRLGAIWFGVGLFLLPFMTIWLSSDLATSMLTHGFLVMLLMLSFLKQHDSHEDRRRPGGSDES
jgi:hypothetical protein